MTRLLDGILDLSLLEGAPSPLALAPIDPEIALENALGVCEGLAAASSMLLLNGPRAAGICVNADSDRLNQVFINLISNAIKYNTNDRPYVRVSSMVREGMYEVLVEDNGPGIGEQERSKIFSKFSRGWAQMQSGTQGAGLGLAISWQIMRRLGGTLELLPRDNNGGSGACFRVRLGVLHESLQKHGAAR